MSEVLLVRYGEVHLKGQNRPFFMSKLRRNLADAVRPYGGRVQLMEGRFIVTDFEDMQEVSQAAARVFGIHSVSPCVAVEKDFGVMSQTAKELTKGLSGTFRVHARRSDKRFAMTSPELAGAIGEQVLEGNPGLSVDLHKPAHVLSVEVREQALLYVETIPAAGGMPMGTNGKAMLLLSGGFDSPVAGYQIARRGVAISGVYFHSPPYTSQRALEKVESLARVLAGYCGPIKLYVVPFTDIQMHLHENGPDELLTILMRRYMMRVSEQLANAEGGQALITGESIGQVASQTMEALAATNAVVTMPVFRPLIGLDKLDIMEQARKIGTHDISILPYEDCCTLFTPKHPATHPKLEKVEAAEAKLEMAELVAKAVAQTQATLMYPQEA